MPPVALVRATNLAIDYVLGLALAEPAPATPAAGGPGRAGLAERLREHPVEDLPAMRRAFAALGDGDLRAGFASTAQDLDASFAFGLAVVLASNANRSESIDGQSGPKGPGMMTKIGR